jgi:hypothetical protein
MLSPGEATITAKAQPEYRPIGIVCYPLAVIVASPGDNILFGTAHVAIGYISSGFDLELYQQEFPEFRER